MPGDLLDDLHEGEGIHLAAVEEAGQQQAEKGGIEKHPQHGLGQPALLLGLLAQVLEQGPERAGPLARARRTVGIRQSTPKSKILPTPAPKPLARMNPYSPGGSGAAGVTL